MSKTKNVNPIPVLVLILVLVTVPILTLDQEDKHKTKNPYTSLPLDLTDSTNCDGVHVNIGQLDGFWTSSYFENLKKNPKPSQIKQKLVEDLEKAKLDQIAFITEQYDKINKEIVNLFKNKEEDIFNQILKDYTKSFIDLFISYVKEQNCDNKDLPLLETYYQRIEDINGLVYLSQELFTNKYDDNFYLSYFIFKNKECKFGQLETLVQEHYKEAQSHYDNLWKNKMDEKTSSFINDRKGFRDTSDTEYLYFIDYTTVNTPESISADLILVNDRYLPLLMFDFIFKHYKNEKHGIFDAIYDVINMFREHALNLKLSISDKTTLVIEFKKYLETIETNDDTYLIIMVFIAESQILKDGIGPLKEKMNPSEVTIKEFIAAYPDLKIILKQLIKDNDINLNINPFDDVDPKRYNQKLGEILDTEDIPEEEVLDDLEEHIKDLKSSDDPEDIVKYDQLEAALFEVIFSYFVNRNNLDPNKILKYKITIDKIAPTVDLYNTDTIMKILMTIDKDGSLKMSFEKMLKFFKNPKAQEYVKDFDKLISKHSDLNKFCEELDLDFKTYGGVQSDMCSGLNPQRPTFEERFFENFIKLLTFVKTFKFYEDNDQMVAYYVNIYKYVALSKAEFNIENNINDMVLRYNTMLAKFTNRAAIKEGTKAITADIYSYHDLCKLINIVNLDLENPEIIKKVRFDTIFFYKLEKMLLFYEIVDQNLFKEFLKNAYGHYQHNPAYYHFNNIYMLLKVHKIITTPDSGKDIENASTRISNIVKSINNIEEPKDKIDLINKIKVSRRAAFFFYSNYIKTYRTEGKIFFSSLSSILKEDIKQLEINNQITLFEKYIVPLVSKTPLGDNNQKPGTNKGFKQFINYGFNKLQNIGLTSSTLYVYLSVDQFKILFAENNHEEIEKSNILSTFIDLVFDVYRINRASRYQLYTEKIGMLSKNFFDSKDNLASFNDLLLVNYYHTIGFFKEYNLKMKDKDLKSLLYEKLNKYYDIRIAQYVKATDGSSSESRKTFGFDIDYLMFSAKLLFNGVYATNQFSMVSMENKTNLNYLFGKLLLEHWPTGKSYYSKNNKLGALEKPLNDIKLTYANLFKLDKVKVLKTLKNLNDNIFVSSCLNKVFAMLMRNGIMDNDMQFLTAITDRCLMETDTNNLIEIIYSLLRNIHYFTRSHKTSLEMITKVKPVFNIILDKAKATLEPKQMIYILKGVLIGKKLIHYNNDFSKFISQITQHYSLNSLNDKITTLATPFNISTKDINHIQNQFIKDLIIVYKDNGYFNLHNFDINKLDLFSILEDNARFSYFLTSIFANVNIDNPNTVDHYLTMYIFISNFRIMHLSEYDIVVNETNNDESAFIKTFTDYVINAFIDCNDKSLKTQLYYLKMVHYMINQKTMQSSLNKNSFIETYDNLLDLSVKGKFNFDINQEELKALISDNSTIKNDTQYFYSQARENVKKDVDRSLQKANSKIIVNEYTRLLYEWIAFAKGLVDEKDPHVYHYKYKDNYEMVQFDINTILKKDAKLLLI